MRFHYLNFLVIGIITTQVLFAQDSSHDRRPPQRLDIEDSMLLRKVLENGIAYPPNYQNNKPTMENDFDKKSNRNHRQLMGGSNQIYLEDFQVNEDVGWEDQYNSDISIAGNGDFVLCWIDERNGTTQVYAQRYSINCSPLGSNFQVSDDLRLSDKSQPRIDMGEIGNFIICWSEEPGNGIYAQMFSSMGEVIGANFKVNDNWSGQLVKEPDISIDDNGNFVIVWSDYRHSDSDIYIQKYSQNGVKNGQNLKLNDDISNANQNCPQILHVTLNKYVVFWVDERNGDQDIYSHFLYWDNNINEANFRVNDDQGIRTQNDPSVSQSSSGDFIVCWSDSRHNNMNFKIIFAQKYNIDGTRIGDNFSITNYNIIDKDPNPDITIDLLGNYWITWHDYKNDGRNIFIQRFLASGSGAREIIKVNDGIPPSRNGYANIVTHKDESNTVCWTDTRDGQMDIYMQKLSEEGIPIGSNQKVNDDKDKYDQWFSQIAVNAEGDFIVCWSDRRNGMSAVYMQQYLPDGTPVGKNTMVNEINGQSHFVTEVTTTPNGDFIICWYDYYDIYARIFSSEGNCLGEQLNLSVYRTTSHQWEPDIIFYNNNFVVSWMEGEAIYYQKFSLEGFPSSELIKVTDSDLSKPWHPGIVIIENGELWICWQDYRNGNADIYLQRFTENDNPIGINKKINDDSSPYDQKNPSLCFDGSVVIICWCDSREGYNQYQIYAQILDLEGYFVDSNFQVNNQINSKDYLTYTNISTSGKGDFIICWHGTNDSNDIAKYAQRYINYEKDNSMLFLSSSNNKSLYRPDIAFNNSRLLSTWSDKRNSNRGWDVYANIRIFPELKLISPNGGEIINIGESSIIEWENLLIDNIKIEYSIDSGSNWITIASEIPAITGSFIWQVPSTASANCKIKISDSSNGDVFDISDATFTIELAVGVEDDLVIKDYAIMQNFPNPFNPTTTIRFTLASPGITTLKIYDVLGREIVCLVDDYKPSGSYDIYWDATGYPSGVYIYKLKSGGFEQTKQMVLVN